jgi:hypothetical protein
MSLAMRPSVRLSFGLLAATSCLTCLDAADAQVMRFYRGPGVVVRAPYVGAIRVGVGAIVPRVVGVPGPILPRRRFVVPPPGAVGPGGLTPRYAPGATQIAPDQYAVQLASPEQLAALDDGSLLNAVLAATAQLDADLGRFATGAGWQKYLRLPEEALPPPTADGQVLLGFAAIEATLVRFDSVAANPKYSMIAELPSFAASQAALVEVLQRYSAAAAAAAERQPTPAEPAGAEELPLPTPTLAR